MCFPAGRNRPLCKKLTRYRIEPGYDDISYCDTSYIVSDILYQLISHC